MSTQQEKFTAIADKIREKTNTTDLIKPSDFASKIDDVYEAGKKSEYDAFWDEFQNYGQPTSYRYAFSSGHFTDENYNPKYAINIDGGSAVNSQDIYSFSPITDTKVDIDISKCSGSSRMFSVSEIVTIRKLIVSERTAYSSAFYQAYNLQNITIEGTIAKAIDFGYSPLTKDSIISVINALSSETSNLTVTFNKTAVNTAFGIDVDDETTFPVGSEYYILRNSKSNWNFNYYEEE